MGTVTKFDNKTNMYTVRLDGTAHCRRGSNCRGYCSHVLSYKTYFKGIGHTRESQCGAKWISDPNGKQDIWGYNDDDEHKCYCGEDWISNKEVEYRAERITQESVSSESSPDSTTRRR